MAPRAPSVTLPAVTVAHVVACPTSALGTNAAAAGSHASPLGLTCLLCCLAAAASYQQAPLREQETESDQEATNQMLPLVHDTSAERDSTPAKPIISA